MTSFLIDSIKITYRMLMSLTKLETLIKCLQFLKCNEETPVAQEKKLKSLTYQGNRSDLNYLTLMILKMLKWKILKTCLNFR